VFDHEIAPHWLEPYLRAMDHALFVAVADGMVIGQARGVLHRQPDSACDLYIDNLGVAPSHKRQGVATALVEALIDWARASAPCRSVWLATEHDNDEGRGFYDAAGFKSQSVLYYAKDFEPNEDIP
jgi:aminoglycoside 6'-N-acetyltransferase I